jgi:hypothetical protein
MKELLKKLGAKPLNESKIKDKSEVLALKIVRKPSKEESEVQSQSSSGTLRPVYIDGVLVEMFESTIIGWVKSGFATVVWPGTGVPVGWGEQRGGYPPIYIQPHIPK